MSDTPPVEDPRRRSTERARSLLLVNTGDGKGKTTAAMGVLMRAVARGWPVAVVQFIKSSDWAVGEEKIARSLGVDWHAFGDEFTWDSEDLDASAGLARKAWAIAVGLIEAGDHKLVVLDELTYPVNWGWIDRDVVVEKLRIRPDRVNVVVTGRDAPDELVEIADTVTEMRAIRHAYDRGVPAKKGIDY